MPLPVPRSRGVVMPKITFSGNATRRGALPMVCLVCGQDADVRLRRNFSWHPPWVIVTLIAGLLPYVLIALILTKYMAVDIPMCRRHRHYWMFKFLTFFGSFMVMVALCVGFGALAVSQDWGGG